MTDEFDLAQTAADFVLSRTSLRPKIAIVLGSGLGAFADELTDSTSLLYAHIPGFPLSTAAGHAGRLVLGAWAGIPIAVMQGRVHLYEGYSHREVGFPMRVLGRMGIRAAILTNAAGGINLAYQQGTLVAISDHINLQGQNPLVGLNDDRLGPRFPDMTEAYNKAYRQLAVSAAGELGIALYEGVYAGLLGPSYETPAEIRYLRTIGADLVGMSTIPETIVARHMGLKVLAISCVTNMAAGTSGQHINHEDVLETGRRVARDFARLLQAMIPAIAADVSG